jgi:hypothetical protein
MIGAAKRTWNVAGVNTTLTKAGINKEVARQITQSITPGSWDLIRDCTKDLNQQCQNLCNSAYALLVYEQLYLFASQAFSEQIAFTRVNINNSIIYQVAMGNKSAIEESVKRFEFVSETYFNHLPTDAGLLVKGIDDLPVTEKRKQTSPEKVVNLKNEKAPADTLPQSQIFICNRDPETCKCFSCEWDRKHEASQWREDGSEQKNKDTKGGSFFFVHLKVFMIGLVVTIILLMVVVGGIAIFS